MTPNIENAGVHSGQNENSSGGQLLLIVVSYLLQSFIAAVFVPGLTLVAGVLTSGITPNWLGWVIDEPYFLLPIAIACATALYLVRRPIRWIRPNWFVWIPALLWLGYSIFHDWYGSRYPGQNFWLDIWNNFFGPQCSSSECLYEWAVTAPLYCSVAYSLTVLFSRRTTKRASHGSQISIVSS